MVRLLAVVALVGCAGPAAPALVASSARLPPPPAVDPRARGADYLTAVAAQLEPRWAAFLEDCRLRLPASHPLNATALAATFDLAIDHDGKVVERRQVATSGNGDFDTAVSDVLADAAPLPAPPPELASDDDLVHLRWQFARDRRQAGPATAQVLRVDLPLAAAIDGMLGRGELARAARRIAAAHDPAAERAAATERVMIAALAEALAGPDSAGRRSAVEACGRARVDQLAGAVRALLAATTDPDVRLAAIATAGALGDRAAAPVLVAALRDDLAHAPRIALARIEALVAIGRGEDAADVVRSMLDDGPSPAAVTALGALGALGAHGLVPRQSIAPRLTAWSTSGDAATRGAVCTALPGAAPAAAVALIMRGLRDPDATVRAICADAAGREDRVHPDPATVRRLRELARDRDRSVRARAVTALAALDPVHPVRAADDPAPEVRAAFAAAATEPELVALLADPAPEVRAAALLALRERGPSEAGASGFCPRLRSSEARNARNTMSSEAVCNTASERAGDAALRAAGDPSAMVRGAAVHVIADTDALARLAGDDSPEVATAALIRLTVLRGRAGATTALLDRLADAPPASSERARIALAWLLAS